MSNIEGDIQDAKHALREAKQNDRDVQQRFKAYEKGKSFPDHGFRSTEEAQAKLAETMLELKSAQSTLATEKENLKEIKKKLKLKNNELEAACREDVMKKAVTRARRFVVHEGRWHAREQGLRRPWDGHNGATFTAWMRYLDSLVREEKDIEEETAVNNRRYVIHPEEAAAQAKTLDEALVSINERREYLSKIRECYDNPPRWSSDESDEDFSEDDFEMPEAPVEEVDQQASTPQADKSQPEKLSLAADDDDQPITEPIVPPAPSRRKSTWLKKQFTATAKSMREPPPLLKLPVRQLVRMEGESDGHFTTSESDWSSNDDDDDDDSYASDPDPDPNPDPDLPQEATDQI